MLPPRRIPDAQFLCKARRAHEKGRANQFLDWYRCRDADDGGETTGNGEVIVAFAMAAAILLIGLAVADFIRDADAIALRSGQNALYATRTAGA